MINKYKIDESIELGGRTTEEFEETVRKAIEKNNMAGADIMHNGKVLYRITAINDTISDMLNGNRFINYKTSIGNIIH